MPLFSNAQVFNTATTLKPRHFSIGLNPVYFNEDLGMFIYGNAGIKSGIDLSLKFGILDGSDYLGFDLEWRLLGGKPDISLLTGIHSWGDFGLDLGLNISFPVKGDIAIYTGLDSDINFNDDVTGLFWIPLGIEIKMRKNISLLFEGEIPISDPAFPIIGGGVSFYF